MNARNRIKVSNFWAVLLILGAVLVYYQYKAKKFKAQILANKAISVGKIISCQYSNRLNYVVDYSFQTKSNETEFGYVNGTVYRDLRNIIVGKTFPLVYDSLNPKTNAILIFPKSFRKYEVPFPDSLRWVLNYDPD